MSGSAAGIKNQFNYSVLIDKNPIGINLDDLGIIVSLNVRQKLPVVKLKTIDNQKLYSNNNPINDGTELKIAFNDGTQGLGNYVSYLSYGTPTRKLHHSGLLELTVYGILNNVSYSRQTANTAFTGSSTAVIKQIASLLNMKYLTNDNTNDSMTWLPAKKTWADFVNYIAAHAWTDNKSVFSHAVDDTNTLFFYNLQKLYENRKPKAKFTSGRDTTQATNSNSSLPEFTMFQPHVINRSGQYNDQGAYNLRTTQTLGDGSVNIYNQVNASKSSTSNLDISKKIAHSMSNRGKIVIAPFDCGNTHSNYINAKHSNERLLKTYSQNLYCLINQYTGLTLYDIVIVEMYSHGSVENSVKGTYCVTAISKCIYKNQYFEKFELTVTGPSNTNPGLF
jgi:hypothetical protein